MTRMLPEIIALGLANLRNQLMRSILTALGIIFGVAAVITMVGIGEGRTAEALRQIESLGATNIIVRSSKPPESDTEGGTFRVAKYGLTYQEVDLVRDLFSDADAIVPAKAFGSQILRGSETVSKELRATSQAFGTTWELADVLNLGVARGRYLTPGDIAEAKGVCVIGDAIARQFFALEDPLGKLIRVDDRSLQVVGVLEPIDFAGGAGSALVGRDLNFDIHAPITTVRASFGDLIVRRSAGTSDLSEVEIMELYIRSASRESVLTDAALLERFFEQRRPGLPDVRLIVPYELLGQARKAALTGQIVSGAVAGISLLVGGIGIMNIMLATVTERTREIGIRRALGATRGHILLQFLVETGVLSALGGVIGVGLGVGLSLALTFAVPALPDAPAIGRFFPTDVTLPVEISEWAIAVALIVAMITGLVFGIYPARRAAAQDPIVALRHD